jgi:hypothetical protein
MLRLILALAVALALTRPATAQQGPPPAAAPSPKEKILLEMPQGWYPKGTQRSDKGETTMLYPPGQGGETWSEMLVLQVVRDSQAMPHNYVQQIVEASRTNCDAVGPSPVTEKSINGYPAAALTVSCTKGKRTGKGGLVMVVAMRGREALYVVQRLWQGPAFGRNEAVPVPQDMLKTWGAFARTIGLCDQVDPKHPCPK